MCWCTDFTKCSGPTPSPTTSPITSISPDTSVVTGTTVSTSVGTGTTVSPGPTQTQTPHSTTPHNGSSNGLGVPAIVGIAVAGVILLVLVALGIWYLVRCRRASYQPLIQE